jgi:hypothetical protein
MSMFLVGTLYIFNISLNNLIIRLVLFKLKAQGKMILIFALVAPLL